MVFKLISYRPEYQKLFEDLNMEWIKKYFTVEPMDTKVLKNPEKYILKPGGEIYFVTFKGDIIGTAALKVENSKTIELTKMAVLPSAQGIGAGKYLCQKMIERAKEKNFPTLILYTNSKLLTAVSMYLKLGFKEIPIEKYEYERANIKMKIDFDMKSHPLVPESST